jgi:hypothetical protein
MEFGKGFGSYYSGWDDWVKEYPQVDKDAYPALFQLPADCYEICLEKPLGIAFEETGNGGVVVDYLVEGGNADKSGVIQPGDVLLATTACMGRDGKFERKLIPSRCDLSSACTLGPCSDVARSRHTGMRALTPSWAPSAATWQSSTSSARTMSSCSLPGRARHMRSARPVAKSNRPTLGTPAIDVL